MNWYLSSEKAAAIIDNRRSFWPDSLQLKLKDPFTSSEVSLGNAKDASSVRTLIAKVNSRLKDEAVELAEINWERPPIFCRISGWASRCVEKDCFWIAMGKEPVALLGVGSAFNVVGRHGNPSSGYISPSADPVGAIRTAVGLPGDLGGGVGHTLERRISYTWQTIWNIDRKSIARAQIEGYAIIASCYPANRAEMRRAGNLGIDKIAIVSPIYINQISSNA